MDKQKTAKPKQKEMKECVDEVKPRGEVDGKNDSGPEPEVHGRDLPPQR